jgi:hypothetical protein
MEEFEDVARVAVVMGGESTHQREPIKINSANSPPPQLKVKSRRAWWTLALARKPSFTP